VEGVGWQPSEDLGPDGAWQRMVHGGRLLLPVLNRYKTRLGRVGLEVGPFFHPLLTNKSFANRTIFYLEFNRRAANYLRGNYPRSRVLCHDIDWLSKEGSRIPDVFHGVDFVVVSQVFNYINFKRFLRFLVYHLQDGAYLFVNNVVGYGWPDFFSRTRPRSIPSTMKSIKDAGFEIVEARILEPSQRCQRNKRLLLVGRKPGRSSRA
jgi:hypothetical protein